MALENPLMALVQFWRNKGRWTGDVTYDLCADDLETVLHNLPTFEIGD